MKILTKAILDSLPALGATSEQSMEDTKVIVKLFNPMGAGTWYIVEYDPESQIAYGFVNLGDYQMAELGDFSVAELLEMRFPPFGLGIERDAHFGEHTLKEVFDTVKAGGHI